MLTPRTSHSATLLRDGRVLITGGGDGTLGPEEYDPASDTWSATGSMLTPRTGYTATLLLNGQVLITGGYLSGTPQPLTTAELYTPSTP